MEQAISLPKRKKTMVMVRIPAGEFRMGSTYGRGEPDEFPQHDVWVDEYFIAKFPVTSAEWAVFLNTLNGDISDYFVLSKQTTVTSVDNRYYPRRDCSDYPANGVTWYGADAYCRWLAEKTGKPYRLPTEAEWEKAARAGKIDQYYPWGNEDPLGRAQYQQIWNSPKTTLSRVDAFEPNAYGLCDMVGNVWEWCSDWYDRNYYHSSPHENPEGPESGSLKTLRGGSWGGLDVQIRCGIRVGENPDISESNVGFRVVRSA